MNDLAVIDGEHYPDVVRVAFVSMPYDVVGAVFVGGTEKLRGDEDYGVPVVERVPRFVPRPPRRVRTCA